MRLLAVLLMLSAAATSQAADMDQIDELATFQAELSSLEDAHPAIQRCKRHLLEANGGAGLRASSDCVEVLASARDLSERMARTRDLASKVIHGFQEERYPATDQRFFGRDLIRFRSIAADWQTLETPVAYYLRAE